MDKDALENWREAVVKDYPKLSLKDKIRFSCHKELKCFNQCCADVNIFLTPYDILRMKKRLKITSDEFLQEYTSSITLDSKRLPAVILKMSNDEKKTCPFVSREGCTIYEDRPWSCRMYPIGMASPDKNSGRGLEEFYFVVDIDLPCMGFNENKEWTIEEWKENQGADIYDLKGQSYKEVTLHEFFLRGNQLTSEKSEMFYMACYNLDKFKRFLFESRFFNVFDIDKDTIEKIRSDDDALLDFGYKWIRFSLFGEAVIKVKEDILEEKRTALGL